MDDVFIFTPSGGNQQYRSKTCQSIMWSLLIVANNIDVYDNGGVRNGFSFDLIT